MSSNISLSSPKCVIDRDVLNEETVNQMDDLGLAVFAKLCGANRGAFVMDPPDGKTYGCTAFPARFSLDADAPYRIPDSANLTQSFAAGDIEASAVVEIVDAYVGAVYGSSADPSSDPYGCDVSGLATLTDCNNKKARSLRSDGDTVRAVTLAGAFVPVPWANGGRALGADGANRFYRSSDFRAMAALGVNTVQIPIPRDAFVVEGETTAAISSLLARAERAGLSALLVLVAPHEDDKEQDVVVERHVKLAAAYASRSSTVIALQLPAPLPSLLSAAHSESGTLPVLVPIGGVGRLKDLSSFQPDDYLYAALDVSATESVADVASSDSVGDRAKMFYHESLACVARSPIEWSECYRDTPVYVTSGFDLAVDDCVRAGEEDFRDYGQCDHFDETVSSTWWHDHRSSLASRQLFAYSKGLGWAFSAWKPYGDDEEASDGAIGAPAKLMFLREVAAAGLLPDLLSNSTASDAACLNGPRPDFAMGDDTYAPTPSPPPDCGDGWWNATTSLCDYWIPPPEPSAPTDWRALTQGAAAGSVLMLAVVWAAKNVCGRDDGYRVLP